MSNIGFDGFFFQAEDGIRDQPRSRGLGDVYKRQIFYDRLPLSSLDFRIFRAIIRGYNLKNKMLEWINR